MLTEQMYFPGLVLVPGLVPVARFCLNPDATVPASDRSLVAAITPGTAADGLAERLGRDVAGLVLVASDERLAARYAAVRLGVPVLLVAASCIQWIATLPAGALVRLDCRNEEEGRLLLLSPVPFRVDGSGPGRKT